ncbi:hypothetical protein [Burkholderia gladioli]|uniref:hypothetical protein n=1 Tax=Burkholderia gladioli TaxID=28095 RepID=UPI003EDE860A
MNEHEKIPAQGGEMPPVERAAITGSGGIDTVRGATPAGNAAQERNSTTALTDERIDEIAYGHRNVAGGIYANHIYDFARDVERALLTSPRAGLPRHVLASLECTAVWLEKGNDPQDAARELRACLAKVDAAPAAPVAEAAPYFSGVSELIIRDVCEMEPANPDLSDTICIDVSDLQAIVKRHTESPEAQAVAADGAARFIAEHGHALAKLLHVDAFDIADRDAQIMEAIQRAAVSPATPAAQEHFDEIKATLTGAHTIMENVAAIERRVGPLGSHARGYTHKISAALRHLDALVAGRVAPGTADAISLLRKAHRTLACAALTQIRGGEAVWTEIGRFLATAPAEAPKQFQARVRPWMLECFGPTIAADRVERNHRFLEEALELVQSLGCTASEAHQLVDYTFGRPVGEPAQEVGGVMVTLAALCLANTLDMNTAGGTELARISEPATVLKIRAKQAAKPKHSPLPQAVTTRAPYEWRDTGPLETNEVGAA